jgi:hypothetical protein
MVAQILDLDPQHWSVTLFCVGRSVLDPDPDPLEKHMFLDLPDPDPDPLVIGMDPDPDPYIIMQK